MQKQERRECKLALEKVAFSKEEEDLAKRCEKENKIHTVREFEQEQKEKKLRRDNNASSKKKEFLRKRSESLLKKEAYVSSI